VTATKILLQHGRPPEQKKGTQEAFRIMRS
jgi:hypothetical protein